MTTSADTVAELLVLPDAELTRLVCVNVMGYGANGYYLDPLGGFCSFEPLTDYNYTHAVIERMQEVWAAEGHKKRWNIYEDWESGWRIEIHFYPNHIRYEYALDLEINHPDFARAVCVAAVYDRLQARAEGEREP